MAMTIIEKILARASGAAAVAPGCAVLRSAFAQPPSSVAPRSGHP